VIGLVPSIKDENLLLQTLRGQEYFGQYGEIEKIVVSKAKPGAVNQGVGVYVTYTTKEAAATCINAVDSSMNGDRVLRQVLTSSLSFTLANLRQSSIWNNEVLFGLLAWRGLQQQELLVSARDR
jgi:RNA recognition motif. (a.k.a. RRM, RBD, or RNP domain)